MFVIKRLDGLRNWMKGRAHCVFSVSVRCKRLLFVVFIVLVVWIFLPVPRNFHLSKYFGPYHIDQAYVCLENTLTHWKDAVDAKDAIILHNPLQGEEDSQLAYVGNGNIGLAINGKRYLYISDGESLSIEIPYDTLLTFTIDGTHGQREAIVIDLGRGLVHKIHSYIMEKSCVVVEHIVYANQNKPSLFVQEIKINNHAHLPVRVKFKHNGHRHWKKSKMYTEKLETPSVPLSVVINTMKHPKLKDTDLIVAVGSSSIASVEMVPFESAKSLQFLTAVHTTTVARKPPTTNAPLIAERSVRKNVVEELKSGIQQEESLREEQVAAWRKVWKSGVTVPVSHHPDTPAGRKVNITMYFVLSSLIKAVAITSSAVHPGRCYQGVPTMHTALLWTTPREEIDVANLALKWKNNLISHGCTSFLNRGTESLHQAMVLSFGGFTFSKGHLEFAANPATLQTDIFFHHIDYYGVSISVKLLVSRHWPQATELKVWTEKDDNLFACEAGCQFAPVTLNSKGRTFPIKITSPVTPLLYISNNASHLLTLKTMEFIRKALKDIRVHNKEAHSFLPTAFWVLVTFLIVAFHLYLMKLIYTECFREARTGRFSR